MNTPAIGFDPVCLETEVKFIRYVHTRSAPITNQPYSVGLIEDSAGHEFTVLACSREHNLDLIPLFEGLSVKVVLTDGGVRLAPMPMQPESTVLKIFERLESGYGSDIPDLECTDSVTQIANDEVPQKDAEVIADSEETPMDDPSFDDVMVAMRQQVAEVARMTQELGIASAVYLFFPPSK